MNKISRTRIVFFLLLTILLSGLLYRDSFTAYFFQDDWFTIRISNAKNVADFIGFFNPRRDVIYYRPLGMQIPFFILKSVFSINPLLFHIVTYLIHAVNITLVFLIVKFLTGKKVIAALTAFFYSTSAIHFIPFFWSSTFAFPAGFMLILLSFLFYLIWSKEKKPLYLFIFLMFEILALMTNELALVLPIIFLLHMRFLGKLNKKILLISIIPPLFYIVLRIVYFPKLTDTYSLEFGKKTIKALFVYTLWFFNWPEEIRNQLENFLTGNYAFIASYLHLFVLLGILFLVLSLCIIRFFISLGIKSKKQTSEVKLTKFSLGLLMAGLIFPVLFPNHTYPYYLLPSSLGAYLLISLSIFSITLAFLKSFKLLTLLVICIIWVVGGSSTINFNMDNHWAPARAKISKVVTEDIVNRNPKLKVNEKIYIYNDPYLKVILSGSQAFKVLYSDSTETVYYGNEDLIWKNTSEDNPDILTKRLKLNFVK